MVARPQPPAPRVNFAACARACKGRASQVAVASDDEENWSTADTEHARHAAASHARAESEIFVCMARSYPAHHAYAAREGVHPVYIDNAANLGLTGDLSIFDGPLIEAEPMHVNTAQPIREVS